ncbi:hypothetical protein DAPPUDRAFT_235601 [Daphnia pulex]|uniref:Uncharacterized protein n=1 Tax=Daphnia pulex TaxID=6669 RepID=E9G0A3_DAPPU|nr:hypothetical protein DAPPUDRAFT_235601 [Daphnia pulex]|eukprot:EFX87436.1 hypothetical protein DAPPUDRAFT_235601 [Daphnia pulex]
MVVVVIECGRSRAEQKPLRGHIHQSGLGISDSDESVSGGSVCGSGGGGGSAKTDCS